MNVTILQPQKDTTPLVCIPKPGAFVRLTRCQQVMPDAPNHMGQSVTVIQEPVYDVNDFLFTADEAERLVVCPIRNSVYYDLQEEDMAGQYPMRRVRDRYGRFLRIPTPTLFKLLVVLD